MINKLFANDLQIHTNFYINFYTIYKIYINEYL